MCASPEEQEAFNQLSYYTLAHRDPSFIHQLIVDTYAAQQADETSKPVYPAFALAGLYLHNERGYSGKEVQLAHMRLAKYKQRLPTFSLPDFRGEITVIDVLAAPAGTERDAAIERWSTSTWRALNNLHQAVAEWLHRDGEI